MPSIDVRKAAEGWAVAREGAAHPASVHPTKAEAVSAGRRLALKLGGVELRVHRADGAIASSEAIGAARLDERRLEGNAATRRAVRAGRSEGPRTTLRLPAPLADLADRLADELGISRNDAVLRLATRGAQLYRDEVRIATRRAERWAAIVPGAVDVDLEDFPSPEESRDAILAARLDEEPAGSPPG